MNPGERLEQIISLVEERGLISVKELSQLCEVSEMTIRRDLQRLEEEKRLRRTYGGAIPLSRNGASSFDSGQTPIALQPEGFLVDRVDVLVATSVSPNYDRRLLDRVAKRHIPVIAESLSIDGEATIVAVDNFRAGAALGRWAGEYSRRHFNGQAFALDLSYHLSNTQARSQGFASGLRNILPAAEVVLSVNAQSRSATAYQLTRDALTVHPNVNVIFAINDSTAWGAIRACEDLGIDPDKLLVLPFGLEGDTLRDTVMAGRYCKSGIAMFPEIVGPVCIEAAIAAFHRCPLPRHLVTPHTILTAETLPELYSRTETGWQIRWEAVRRTMSLPLDIDPEKRPESRAYPRRIGFVVPFSEHEWYKNLTACMKAYASALKIQLEVVDAEQNLKDELDLIRRRIAQAAAEQVQPGDVLLLDHGQITGYLAEELAGRSNFTVISNSMAVLDALKSNRNITVISTGGVVRHATDCLVGPTAEAALRELRADKLFLAVAGITQGFGLSHTSLAEVTIKQAMIRSAREVILLADHTLFGQESVMQIAPVTAVHKVIADEALPASTRLDLTKLGIEVLMVRT